MGRGRHAGGEVGRRAGGMRGGALVGSRGGAEERRCGALCGAGRGRRWTRGRCGEEGGLVGSDFNRDKKLFSWGLGSRIAILEPLKGGCRIVLLSLSIYIYIYIYDIFILHPGIATPYMFLTI